MGRLQGILNIKHVDITAPFSNFCGKKGLSVLISMNIYCMYTNRSEAFHAVKRNQNTRKQGVDK